MKREIVDDSTILLVNAGSHAYGTSLPTSDRDIRGVMIPPIDYFLGLSRVDQYEEKGLQNENGLEIRPDLVVYEIRKYVALAADANPNILEIIFVDDSDVIKETSAGAWLRRHRRMFLSTKARHTFSGYAMSQLRRIESHRRWLLSPPSAPPKRADFGLEERNAVPGDQLKAAEAIIRKQVEAWENVLPTFGVDVTDPAAVVQMRELLVAGLTEMKLATDDDRFLAAGRKAGFDSNFLDMLDREHKYAQRRREWDGYQQWLVGRNEARSVLERHHGYDTKHGMHLVRLMRMCAEILERGEVLVRRPDAAELLEIRHGAWSYDRLIGWAREQDARMAELAAKSSLPRSPDRTAISELCVELVSERLCSAVRSAASVREAH